MGEGIPVPSGPQRVTHTLYDLNTGKPYTWNCALTPEEIAAISDGADPDTIRPECRVRNEPDTH